jgi:hypothetical protein
MFLIHGDYGRDRTPSDMASFYQALPSDYYVEKSGKRSYFTYYYIITRPYILHAYSVLISVVLLCVLLVNTLPASSATQECQRPAFRREWRTLNEHEKRDYIQAVQCLRDVPSRVGTKYSLYEDFAYVHAQGSGISMLQTHVHFKRRKLLIRN